LALPRKQLKVRLPPKVNFNNIDYGFQTSIVPCA
jgi:hypothetical protein